MHWWNKSSERNTRHLQQSASAGDEIPHDMNKLPECRPPCLTSFKLSAPVHPIGENSHRFRPICFAQRDEQAFNRVVLKLFTGKNVNEILNWCASSSRWKAHSHKPLAWNLLMHSQALKRKGELNRTILEMHFKRPNWSELKMLWCHQDQTLLYE